MSLCLRVNALKEAIGEKIQCVGLLSTGTSAIKAADGLIENIGAIAQLGERRIRWVVVPDGIW